MRADNCRNIYIHENEITKTGVNPSMAVFPKIRGIRLLNSQGCTVTKNTVEKCGSGISAYGNCAPSNLECNILDKNFYGFNFEGPAGTASVGTQVVGSLPTGNTWTTLGNGFDLQGGVAPIISWYYPTNGYQPSAFLVQNSLTNSNTPLQTPLSDRCSSFFAPTPPDDREARLGKTVRDELVFDNFPDENKRFGKKYALKELSDNPGLLSLGTNDDTTYQNFYAAEQNTCIGIFTQTEELLLNRQFTPAVQLLNNLSPQNTWEYNLKRVCEIAPYYMSDSLTPTPAMIQELENIAWQNSMTGGPGVISARVMLQWDVEDEVNEPRRMIVSSNTDIPKNDVKVYPNPATNICTVAFTGQAENFTVKLVDITGKTVKTLNITQQQSIELDLQETSPGVYFIEVVNQSNSTIHREKLVKTK